MGFVNFHHKFFPGFPNYIAWRSIDYRTGSRIRYLKSVKQTLLPAINSSLCCRATGVTRLLWYLPVSFLLGGSLWQLSFATRNAGFTPTFLNLFMVLLSLENKVIISLLTVNLLALQIPLLSANRGDRANYPPPLSLR